MKATHYKSDYGTIRLIGEPQAAVVGAISTQITAGFEDLTKAVYEQTGEFRELYVIDKQTLDAILESLSQ